ncbi:hypothetical protein [Dinghuibacter silviterrae]|uniref:Uncharacterized protein n=1 Tax=Dinghuibacter silviterrae TaxID=1539049 RepID=A0A4R8DHZ0_9BACT|nr:hypothetical protein [Dinghuibacter silviterrae]TDW97155.1 hypothetical protein EDB95_4997 [Dinghuibacter silviterrae]
MNWDQDIPNSAIVAAHQPLHLTPEYMRNPGKFIRDFFHAQTLDEARRFTTALFNSAICAPSHSRDGVSKSDIVFAHGQFLQFVEAVYWFHRDEINIDKGGDHGRTPG